MQLRNAELRDLDRCYEIEQVSYSGDEAATREKIETRIRQYPDGFLVLEINKQVVGFINCGACFDVEMSDEAFKELIGHDAEGPNIVIMSVVVHPDFQHQGYASVLMHEFIERMKSLNKEAIYLMCQTELIDFYARFGFCLLGASSSNHGGLNWQEMRLELYE